MLSHTQHSVRPRGRLPGYGVASPGCGVAPRALLLAIGLTTAIAWAPARAEFVTGDLYVLSQAAPGIGQGILRVDPLTATPPS